MTTLTLNIKDDRKVEDVFRFLRDIDFLEVLVKTDKEDRPVHRSPAQVLRGTRILGDIMGSVVPDSDWEALCETSS